MARLLSFRSASSGTGTTSLFCSPEASETVQHLGLALVGTGTGHTFHCWDLVSVQLDIVITGILVLRITSHKMDSAYAEGRIVCYEPSNN
jgi:hypothetical protein